MSDTRDNFNIKVWRNIAFSFWWVLLIIALPINAEETKQQNSSKLPQSPQTGVPEEDFSAGGTRGNDLICNVNRQEPVNLLGNQNREYTLSPHPTFWFHFPDAVVSETPIEFTVTEVATGKAVYSQAIEKTIEPGIVGIALPTRSSSVLLPETNYSWNLAIDCQDTDRQSDIVLSGWLQYLPVNPQLKQELSIVAKPETYKVYLKHNLLYDALTELARNRINSPNDIRVKNDWQKLLADLGWQNFSSTQRLHMLNNHIFNSKK